MDQPGQHSDSQMVGQPTRHRSCTHRTIRHITKNIGATDSYGFLDPRHAVNIQPLILTSA
jgi:hypothetical protein